MNSGSVKLCDICRAPADVVVFEGGEQWYCREHNPFSAQASAALAEPEPQDVEEAFHAYDLAVEAERVNGMPTDRVRSRLEAAIRADERKRVQAQDYDCIHCGENDHGIGHWERCDKHPAQTRIKELTLAHAEREQQLVEALTASYRELDEALTPWMHGERIDPVMLVRAMSNLSARAVLNQERPA